MNKKIVLLILLLVPFSYAKTVVCSGTTDTDTNAETLCIGDDVYLSGEGNCNTISASVTDTDTNATTECSDTTLLRGDGTCREENLYLDTFNTTYDSGLTDTNETLRVDSLESALDGNSTQLLGVNTTANIEGLGFTQGSHTTDTDTNFTTECPNDEVGLGEGDCVNLNDTITALDTDTTYTASNNLTLVGTDFQINATHILDWLDDVYQAVGSYVTSEDVNNTPVSEFSNDAGYITSTENIFDQNLNTTSYVEFFSINITDWSNITITESQITDLTHTTDTDTNATTECGDNEYLRGDGTCQTLSLTDTNETSRVDSLVTDLDQNATERYADNTTLTNMASDKFNATYDAQSDSNETSRVDSLVTDVDGNSTERIADNASLNARIDGIGSFSGWDDNIAFENESNDFVGDQNITNGSLQVSTLINCDTIDTDGLGNFSCGTDADTPFNDEGVNQSITDLRTDLDGNITERVNDNTTIAIMNYNHTLEVINIKDVEWSNIFNETYDSNLDTNESDKVAQLIIDVDQNATESKQNNVSLTNLISSFNNLIDNILNATYARLAIDNTFTGNQTISGFTNLTGTTYISNIGECEVLNTTSTGQVQCSDDDGSITDTNETARVDSLVTDLDNNATIILQLQSDLAANSTERETENASINTKIDNIATYNDVNINITSQNITVGDSYDYWNGSCKIIGVIGGTEMQLCK